jgi:hypothetical protein
MWIVTYEPAGCAMSSQPEKPNAEGLFGKTDYGPGWYLAWDCGYQYFCVPLAFARESDARMALKSIEHEKNWCGSNIDVFQQMNEFGLGNFRRLMTENLAW